MDGRMVNGGFFCTININQYIAMQIIDENNKQKVLKLSYITKMY